MLSLKLLDRPSHSTAKQTSKSVNATLALSNTSAKTDILVE